MHTQKSVSNRNAPTTTTATTNLSSVNSYQWPPSPILPPISSRTPHLIPETLLPTTRSELFNNKDNNYSSHDKNNDNGGACSF